MGVVKVTFTVDGIGTTCLVTFTFEQLYQNSCEIAVGGLSVIMCGGWDVTDVIYRSRIAVGSYCDRAILKS